MISRRGFFQFIGGVLVATQVPRLVAPPPASAAVSLRPSYQGVMSERTAALINELKRHIDFHLRSYLFEQNDGVLRAQVTDHLSNIFESYREHGKIYDYMIVCNESNNPLSVVNSNELRVHIHFKVTRDMSIISFKPTLGRDGVSWW